MAPMRRRAFLASTGVMALPFTGCAGEPNDDTPARSGSPPRTTTAAERATPVRRSIGESAEVDGEAISMVKPRIRKMIVADFGIWGDLQTADDQYLLVDILGPDGTSRLGPYEYSSRLPLAVELDGKRYDPESNLAAVVRPDRPPIDPESIEEHAVALPVPTAPVESAAVIWEGEDATVRWEIPSGDIGSIATEPSFEMRSFETDGTPDKGIGLDMEIANTGGRAGLWLGQVSIQTANDISEVFGFTIPVDTTIERTVRPDLLRPPSVDSPVTIQFWSTTYRERMVTADADTPS